jgi:hypothetical protein
MEYINFIVDFIESLISCYSGGLIGGRDFSIIFHQIKSSTPDKSSNPEIELINEILYWYANEVFEYYEEDPRARAESPDFYGDDELDKKVQQLLDKIAKYRTTNNLLDLAPEDFKSF